MPRRAPGPAAELLRASEFELKSAGNTLVVGCDRRIANGRGK